MIFTIAGNIGVAAILGAYFLLNTGRLDVQTYKYQMLNLVGASLVIISLIESFNLAAFILEAFWVMISLVGLFRLSRKKHVSRK